MKLLDLLLQNWVFVAIAFFVLSSMFKKNGSRGQDAERGPETGPKGRPQGMPTFGGGPDKPRRNPMPPFGGDRSGWPTSQESPPVRKKPVAAAPLKPVRQAADEYDRAELHRERSDRDGRSYDYSESGDSRTSVSQASGQETARAAYSPSEASLGRLQASGSTSAASGEPLGALRPEDVARGVLWAEILGPPRAKNPYRRR
ncbi:hypothetical protein [Paenibacillus puerhi]|uniref:hypothetical protein n=1 Tax=Paenibacillus puerhi TaxID=2692622 RepID=UPI00135A0213|nr:hypothetical protein [Paenibacillus puerhi]